VTLEPNLINPNSVQFLTKTVSVTSRTLVAVAGGQAEETQQGYEADFVIRRMDRPLFDDIKSALSLSNYQNLKLTRKFTRSAIPERKEYATVVA